MADRVRSATINRDTNETKIQLSLNLDGGVLEDASESSANGEAKSHAAQTSKSQTIDVDSGIGFLDHMIHALAKHAGWSLRIRCRGDLHSTYPLLRFLVHAHRTTRRETSTTDGTYPPQSTTTTPQKTPSSPSAPPSNPH